MRRLTTRLLQSGFTKLATQAHLETERLQAMGSLSEEGRRKIKYGTRALLAQAISLDKT
jgi:Ca-activated chloride channel family protein